MNRCGNCWQYGHNKRTCPKVTEQWKTRYDEAVTDKHQAGIDHWGERIANRTGTDPRNGAKVNRRSGIVRRCSYCKYVHGSYGDEGVGHTRVTCKHLKKDRVEEKKKNATIRKQVVEAMKREGVGVGAIIGFNSYDYYSNENGDKVYESRTFPYMVVAINWDCITDQYGAPRALAVKRLDRVCKAGSKANRTFPLPLLHEIDNKTVITNSGGANAGNWVLKTNAQEYDAKFLMERAPANGWDTIPSSYYQGSSRNTDSWFDEKKR